jgi:hypothetical protein
MCFKISFSLLDSLYSGLLVVVPFSSWNIFLAIRGVIGEPPLLSSIISFMRSGLGVSFSIYPVARAYIDRNTFC